MKHFILIISLIISSNVFSQDININEAKKIAIEFLTDKTKTKITADFLKINNIFKSNNLKSKESIPAIYSFDISDDNGYILIASKKNIPVIAYAKEGNLNNEKDNYAFKKYISIFIDQIKVLENIEIKNTPKVKSNQANTDILLTSEWGQNAPYNNKVPIDIHKNKNFPTGCIATAMAQVMYYHRHPKSGFGHKKYYHSNDYVTLGDLTANMAESKYKWDIFPSKHNSSHSDESIDNLSLLLYDCGISVQMNYNSSSRGGSGAYLSNVEKALELHFNYHDDTEYIIKKFHDSWLDWENKLIENLRLNLPIIYSGVDTKGQGGHAWVLDGLENRNGINYFHMNWGWNGSKNNYVLISDIIPKGTLLNYSRSPRAIINIKPDIEPLYKLVSEGKIEVYHNLQYDTNRFTVNIKNEGNSYFKGNIFISIYDKENNFIGIISELKKIELEKNELKTNIQIYSEGINLLPGDYKISINYNNEGKEIIETVKNLTHDTYQDLKLDRAFTLGSLKIIGQTKLLTERIIPGEEYSIEVSIINPKKEAYTGEVSAAFFDFRGNYKATISTIKLTNFKQADTIKKYVFKTDNLEIEPGKYIMTIVQSVEDYSYIINYTDGQNEIIVNVANKPYIEDEYENNDTLDKASELKLNYINNIAKIKTTNTNIHINKNIDFYKLKFDNEYEYKIKATIHDSSRSSDGKEYTCDIIWSIYEEGNKKYVFDDISPSIITHTSGKDMTLSVQSYFTNDIGTYSIDFTIIRKKKIILSIDNGDAEENVLGVVLGVVDVVDDEQKDVKAYIYPNPSSDYIYIENAEHENNKIEIFNSNGNKIMQFNNTYSIDIKSLNRGLYIIKCYNSKKTSFLKFVKI